jgi:hypothetical protein
LYPFEFGIVTGALVLYGGILWILNDEKRSLFHGLLFALIVLSGLGTLFYFFTWQSFAGLGAVLLYSALLYVFREEAKDFIILSILLLFSVAYVILYYFFPLIMLGVAAVLVIILDVLMNKDYKDASEILTADLIIACVLG